MTERPYFCEGSDAMIAFESMVDRAGLRNVLYALAHISAEKADHLRANWQDNASAKNWAKASAKMERAAVSLPL